MADTSVVKLFVAGVIPGLLVGVTLMALNYIVAVRNGYPTEPWVSWRALARSFGEALPGLVMPLIVIGGMLGGIFTATEGAAIAVVYGLFVGLFIYRDLQFTELPRILLDSMKSSAAILFIIANASLFGVVLSLYQVGSGLAIWFSSISPNSFVLLAIINLSFLVMGILVDSTAALIILVPLLLTTLDTFGIDRTHFGVIAVLNLGVGLMLPPHGLAMLIVLRIAKLDMITYLRAAWPVVVAMFLALIAVTYFPAVTLWLPQVLGV